MSSSIAEIDRLALTIDRLIDADLLSDHEEAALRTAITSARHSVASGDVDGAERQVVRLIRLAESLVESGALAVVKAKDILQSANRFLLPDSGEGM